MDPEAKLTFRDLGNGDKFIAFPLPGDNHGHGGFLGVHFIFMKTRENKLGDNATRLSDGTGSRMSESMPVIQVK